ncbi:MAG: hypothetical protein H0U08_10215 [Actinobacteria bacterium]|nr:hypothetical protein [Actinomycetota bacterium]
MTSRAFVVGLLACVLLLTGIGPAASDPPRSVSSYYLARADPRLCPSPFCGGIWVRLVNREKTTCGDGAARSECYAAMADLRPMRNTEEARARLAELIGEGRALARGNLVRGLVPGFPELDVLVVSEVWTASSSRVRPRGAFYRLRDNGVRCITTPCFSTHAAVLNTGRHDDVSDVDLTRTGAPRKEQLGARTRGLLTGAGLISSGRVLRAGKGRTFIATQFYAPRAGLKLERVRLAPEDVPGEADVVLGRAEIPDGQP